MFQVNAEFVLDEEWEEKNEEVYRMAGRLSDFSGASCVCGEKGIRHFTWLVRSFRESQRMKRDLEKIKEIKVTIREHTSEIV